MLQKGFNYTFGRNMDYPKPWNNERLTDLLIQKFIESKQFELVVEEIDEAEVVVVTSESDEKSESTGGETVVAEREVEIL